MKNAFLLCVVFLIVQGAYCAPGDLHFVEPNTYEVEGDRPKPWRQKFLKELVKTKAIQACFREMGKSKLPKTSQFLIAIGKKGKIEAFCGVGFSNDATFELMNLIPDCGVIAPPTISNIFVELREFEKVLMEVEQEQKKTILMQEQVNCNDQTPNKREILP